MNNLHVFIAKILKMSYLLQGYRETSSLFPLFPLFRMILFVLGHHSKAMYVSARVSAHVIFDSISISVLIN